MMAGEGFSLGIPDGAEGGAMSSEGSCRGTYPTFGYCRQTGEGGMCGIFRPMLDPFPKMVLYYSASLSASTPGCQSYGS